MTDDDILERLREVPLVEGRDQTAAVLTGVRRVRRRARVFRGAVVCVTAAVCALGIGKFRSSGVQHSMALDCPRPLSTAIESFLMETQQADGTWNSALWGGDSRYVPAVTALSVEYLLEGAHRSALHKAIERGIAALAAGLQESGLRPSTFDLYNLGIVTAVLLRAEEEGYTVPQSAIESGLGRFCTAQLPEGGWGLRSEDPAAHPSVTAWQLRALTLAKGRKVPGLPQALARGTLWLDSQREGQGTEDPTCRDRAMFAQRVALATAPLATLQ